MFAKKLFVMKNLLVLFFLVTICIGCNPKVKPGTVLMYATIVEKYGQPEDFGISDQGAHWYVFKINDSIPPSFEEIKHTIDKTLNNLPIKEEQLEFKIGKKAKWETPDYLVDLEYGIKFKTTTPYILSLWVTNK